VGKQEEHIAFVKAQVGFHERQKEKYSSDLRRSEMHEATAERFEMLADYLEGIQTQVKNGALISTSEMPRLDLSWSEIEDLPDDLLEELSISESDKLDFAIVAAVTESGGVASLDRILVHVFRQTSQICKRANMNSRVYRLMQKGLLFSVPGKKGIYCTRQLTEDEAAKLV
jgi:hypothetical protein